MLAWPAHAGMGDDFGTRDPALCPLRHAPDKGAPSPQQAMRYLACDTERVGDRGALMILLGELRLQVDATGRAFDAKSDDFAVDADPAQAVYPIRGDFRIYQCSRSTSPEYLADPGHACRYRNFYGESGLCWRDIAADWHCAFPYQFDAAHSIHNAAPPKAGSYMAIGSVAPPGPSGRRSSPQKRKQHHHKPHH